MSKQPFNLPASLIDSVRNVVQRNEDVIGNRTRREYGLPVNNSEPEEDDIPCTDVAAEERTGMARTLLGPTAAQKKQEKEMRKEKGLRNPDSIRAKLGGEKVGLVPTAKHVMNIKNDKDLEGDTIEEAPVDGVIKGQLPNDEHMCATNIFSEEYGEGKPIHSAHADPDEEGNIEWYDVMFEHGIERVFTADVTILSEMSHGNHKKKRKKKVDESLRVVNRKTGEDETQKVIKKLEGGQKIGKIDIPPEESMLAKKKKMAAEAVKIKLRGFGDRAVAPINSPAARAALGKQKPYVSTHSGKHHVQDENDNTVSSHRRMEDAEKALARYLSEEGGAGDTGTKKLVDKYKKDTPGQDERIAELFTESEMFKSFPAIATGADHSGAHDFLRNNALHPAALVVAKELGNKKAIDGKSRKVMKMDDAITLMNKHGLQARSLSDGIDAVGGKTIEAEWTDNAHRYVDPADVIGALHDHHDIAKHASLAEEKETEAEPEGHATRNVKLRGILSRVSKHPKLAPHKEKVTQAALENPSLLTKGDDEAVVNAILKALPKEKKISLGGPSWSK